ncbi:uncharacterized protein LOC106140100 [Amyelois transitella]|uniref:uncharacterized protein LOC106140100 n=1 Tax=Amyelois transitella TaxID=680683 RepID=UPI00067BC531|nr:uncharacterized protein LOC106140100 [Amyelois transitella]
MTLVLRKYLLSKNNALTYNMCNAFRRTFSGDRSNDTEFISSTILVENGFNVQELPVVVRKWKNVELEEPDLQVSTKSKNESISYQLIQAEFRQCVDLRDVFSLLSKCTKITPNIALGAMERIQYLENNPSGIDKESKNMHINLAKGAILDKLIKVVLKTEDTQTILNIIQSTSLFMEPYKSKFCDELLFRTLDNKLDVEQICTFLTFLIENKTVPQYSTTIDKLWVGFIQREGDINEENIGQIFSILSGLKVF